MRFLNIFLVLLLTFACSTINVVPIKKETTSTKPGLVYALPSHKLDVVVAFEKKVVKGSKFLIDNKITDNQMDAALKEFGLRIDYTGKDVNKSSYKIKDVSIKTRVIPDKEQIFFIEARNRNHPFYKKTFLFELTPQGYMTQGKAEGTDYTLDFAVSTVVSGIKIAAGVAGYPIPSGSDEKPQADINKIKAPEGQEKLYDILREIKLLELDKMDLLLGKNDLSNLGQQPDINVILKQLIKQQEELIKVFAGSVTTSSLQFIKEVDPKIGKAPLFKFDKSSGPDNGKQYSIEITSEDYSNLKNFLIKNDTSQTAPKKGLHYRIPATTKVRIISDKEELYYAQHIIPQLGNTAFLPSRVGWSKNSMSYSLDPNTGALLKFEANSEGLDLAALKTLTSEAEGFPELFTKEKDSVNEFEGIEKQIKQLELENTLLEQQIKNDSLSYESGQ